MLRNQVFVGHVHCEGRNKQAFDFLLMTNPQLINQVSTRPTVRFFSLVLPPCMQSQAPADVYNSRDFSFKMVQCNSKQHQLRRRDPASRSTIKMVASAISTAFTKGVCKIVAPKASPNWLLAKVQTQIVARKLKDLTRSRVALLASKTRTTPSYTNPFNQMGMNKRCVFKPTAILQPKGRGGCQITLANIF